MDSRNVLHACTYAVNGRDQPWQTNGGQITGVAIAAPVLYQYIASATNFTASARGASMLSPDIRVDVCGSSIGESIIGRGGAEGLYGDAGNDTYVLTSQYGKDVVVGSDGKGSIVFYNQYVGNAVATGKANQWGVDLGAGQVAFLNVLDDSRSATGKRLLITQGTDTANSITIQNFNLTQALGSEGYLGLKLDPTKKLAIKESTGTNVWADTSFTLDQLAGQNTNGNEGTGKSSSIFLSQASNTTHWSMTA